MDKKKPKKLMELTHKLGEEKNIKKLMIATGIAVFLVGNFLINLLGSAISTNSASLFNNPILFFFKIDFSLIANYNFFKFLYITLIGFVVVMVFRIRYNLKANYTEQNVGQKGDQRFSTQEEVRAQYKEIADTTDTFPGHGGLPVAHYGNKMYIDDTTTNNMLLGITRSGKGECFVLPMIDIYSRAEQQPSIVAVDMKLELVSMSYETLVKRGYDVYLLNLENPNIGIQFNPLELIVQFYCKGNVEAAELLCNSYAYSQYADDAQASSSNDRFFLDNATAALSSLIIAHTEDTYNEDKRLNAIAKAKFLRGQLYSSMASIENIKLSSHPNDSDVVTIDNIDDFTYIPQNARFEEQFDNLKKNTMYSIVNTFQELARIQLDEKTTLLDMYFRLRPAFNRAKAIYSSIEVSGDRTKSSIFSQALSRLTLYSYDSISNLTSKSTLDLSKIGFGEKPVALFIGVPFYDRSKDVLVSTIISQIYEINSRAASATNNLKCPRRIIFHLDEIGNFPAIKNLDTMLSIGLGINMLFNLFIQSFTQIDNRYGKVANIIKENCGNIVYIQTQGTESSETFSKLLGNKTITNVNRSGTQLSQNKSYTEMYEQQPLLAPDRLRRLQEGENVIYRVMKRRDNNGNSIEPMPIFNNCEDGTQFAYRYQYLHEDFPNVDIPIRNLIPPREDKTDVEDITFDYNIAMMRLKFAEIIDSGNIPKELSEEEYSVLQERYIYCISIDRLSNGSLIHSICSKAGIQLDKRETGISLIDKFFENPEVELETKISIIDLIEGSNTYPITYDEE